MRKLILVLLILGTINFTSQALQITQIEFDLHQAAGSTSAYSFKVINNESQAQEITIYLSDWTRTSTGENDFLALNSARWLFARAFHADDELDIKYRALIPSDSITVKGTYACGSPSAEGEVVGKTNLLSSRTRLQQRQARVP